MNENSHSQKYIASLDIGTTSLRCFIYDVNVHIVGKSCSNVKKEKILCLHFKIFHETLILILF